jgi:hypothetical protein
MPDALPIMGDGLAAVICPLVALIAILFGAFLAWRVAQVRVRGSGRGGDAGREYLLDEAATGEDEVSIWGGGNPHRPARRRAPLFAFAHSP